MGVNSLGYVALDVVKLDAWLVLATKVFGLQVVPRPGSDAVDLRMDDRHHRLSLTPAGHDGIAAIGWEIDSAEGLEALAGTLRQHGLDLVAGTAAACAERQVERLYRFTEPMIGVATEIYHGALVPGTPFQPSREISGYNSGPGLGLGHIVFWVKDLQAAVDFYTGVMGFNISDYIAWDDNDAVFLHCNPRHHTLALMAEAPGRPAGALNHIMLEAKSYDDVGHGYDIVRDLGMPVMIEPGKHSNDHMQSFYLKTPSGFWMEYGYGGRVIGDGWQVSKYDAPMLWGHRMVAP